MTNAIDNLGDSMPFDMGNMGDTAAAGQNDMQTDAASGSVRMFSPDDAGDAGGGTAAAQHAGHAAAQDGGAAAQKGASGTDTSSALGPIMDIVKSLISAATQLAPPLLGMFTSMIGKTGTAGGSAA